MRFFGGAASVALFSWPRADMPYIDSIGVTKGICENEDIDKASPITPA